MDWHVLYGGEVRVSSSKGVRGWLCVSMRVCCCVYICLRVLSYVFARNCLLHVYITFGVNSRVKIRLRQKPWVWHQTPPLDRRQGIELRSSKQGQTLFSASKSKYGAFLYWEMTNTHWLSITSALGHTGIRARKVLANLSDAIKSILISQQLGSSYISQWFSHRWSNRLLVLAHHLLTAVQPCDKLFGRHTWLNVFGTFLCIKAINDLILSCTELSFCSGDVSGTKAPFITHQKSKAPPTGLAVCLSTAMAASIGYPLLQHT